MFYGLSGVTYDTVVVDVKEIHRTIVLRCDVLRSVTSLMTDMRTWLFAISSHVGSDKSNKGTCAFVY